MDEVEEEIRERWELLELAGSGGMGRVYRARDRTTGELVALKVLPSSGGDRLRFARESAVLASLGHPAVVRYRDGGATKTGVPYLAMEWLEGHDLDDRLRSGPLDVEQTIALGVRLSGALAAAHARGIVHRDLKPANVFLVSGSPENAKLIDFGVARPSRGETVTLSGTIVGTPTYMAPEQVRGDRLDARADVYGLGAVLFCCLVGQPPFRGPHDLAVLAKVVLEDAPDVRTLRPHVPAALASLVARMLAKSREDRPESTTIVEQELRAIQPSASLRSTAAAIPSGERRVASFVLCNLRGRDSAQTVVERAVAPEKQRRADDDVVTPFGGTLHPLVHDAIIVTIRGGSSPAEQASRAARCALALAAEHPTSPIVVVTGRVVVDGDVQVGEAIDRAAEAVLADDAAGVRIDTTTAELLGDRFEVRGDDKWRSLIGEREATSTGIRTFLGRPSPCVGRTRELAQLTASFAECVDEGRAQIVLLSAPTGLGKSRLLHELLRTSVAEHGKIDLSIANADPVREGSGFAIASQLIARKAGMLETDSSRVRASKLSASIEPYFYGPDAKRVIEFLGEICGAYVPASEASAELRAARADLTTMGDTLREVWIAWIRARTARGPVVLALEDLHWADLPSLRLIEAALGAASEEPLLVVGTTRPESAGKLEAIFKNRVYQEVRLNALSPKAAQMLARETLGASATDAVVDALVARAAGHPFYLEELVRAVVAGQRPDALPDSVLGMVQARLDDFDQGTRQVLRVASVYGERFWTGAVEALLAPEERAQVAAQLRDLVENELVVRRNPSRVHGETEYAFRHGLFRDAAYAMLPDEARAIGHRLAGEWLEKVGEGDPAVLAEHFHRGSAPDRALPFFVQAARRALEASDLDRAAQHADRASSCDPDEATRGTIAAITADVAYWRGDLDLAVQRAEEAATRLPAASSEWFAAASTAISAFGQRGRNDDVAQWMTRVASAEAGEEARAPQAVALCRAMTQLLWSHRRDALVPVRARFEALVSTVGSLDPYTTGWIERVRAEAAWLHDRDVDRCLGSFAKSSAAFERAHAARPLLLVAANEAILSAWSGDTARGLARIAAARSEALRLGSGFLASYGLAVTGMIQLFDGQAEGEASLKEALASLGGSPRLSFICRLYVGWAAHARGDLDVAEEMARAACATEVVDDLKRGAHALLALVLVARGRLDEASNEAERGDELRRRTADLELTEGLVEVALAAVAEARGDRERARAVLAEARARLASIGSTIADDEQRARFFARRVANDQLTRVTE